MSDTAKEAPVPNAGDWIVCSGWGREVRQVEKVTPKLIKLAGRGYTRQIKRKQVIAVAGNKDLADQIKQAIDGIEGEFSRRRRAANDDFHACVRAAREAADQQIARYLKGLSK